MFPDLNVTIIFNISLDYRIITFSFVLFFCLFLFFVFWLFFFCFLGPYLQHMEAPSLGVKSELQLPAYTTATARWNLSCICDLHHSSWQHWIPDPLREARDRTCILVDTSQICFCFTTMGIPNLCA